MRTCETFHPIDAAGAELPPLLNNPFDYEPHPLCQKAFRAMLGWPIMRGSDAGFGCEIARGKMFGTLIVESGSGRLGFLAAFSGQIGGRFDWPGFVPPVFDYLSPAGYFKSEERAISAISSEITAIEGERLRPLESAFGIADMEQSRRVAKAEAAMREGKAERDRRRAERQPTEAELAAMTRQSQFLKAELRRAKQARAAALDTLSAEIKSIKDAIEKLKRLRRHRSEALQEWLFGHTLLCDSGGEELSVAAIFAQSCGTVPPSGSGECCAPKLLHYAFAHRLRPIAMAEYWFGQSPTGEVRHHGSHYPACRGKCKPLLEWMLRDVRLLPATRNENEENPDILYEDSHFCVVCKPAGMISVPGRSPRKSLLDFLRGHYGENRDVRLVHRLDEDTSGLVVAAFGIDAYRQLQSLFECRQIEKTYIALLDGDPTARGIAREGCISLPLLPDIGDRPRQTVSPLGKTAITRYRLLGSDGEGRTIAEFRPQTGRTHQLRVHAASAEGLDTPIVGDRLYGRRRDLGTRLMLHAAALRFVSPFDGREMNFRSEPPFVGIAAEETTEGKRTASHSK